jgi:hypothetical protein
MKSTSGLTELQKELKKDGNNVDLAPGDQWLIKAGRLEVGEGTTLNGNGAILYCPENSVRLITKYPRATIRGINAIGAFTHYNYAGALKVEDCRICHSLDGRTYLPLGKKGGATAAFMTWLKPSEQKTLEGITYQRCITDHAYHHGFGMSLEGVAEGAGFKRIRFVDCLALSSGSGLESTGTGQTGDRDWSTGFDVPDTGDIEDLIYLRCRAVDSWQSGFHMDGSWKGHRQIQKGIVLELCQSIDSGRRSGTIPGELYQSGYYLQSGTLINCCSSGSRKAGFHLKNSEPDSLTLRGCRSIGDAYGLVVEYGGVGLKVSDFIAEKNTRRALQATAQRADIDITIRDFKGAGRPVLLGITERLELVDSTKPGNIRTLETRRKDPKPFNGALTIRAAARDLIDVHPPSRSIVSISRVAYIIEDEPTPGTPPIPIPVPQGRIWVEDGWIWVQAPEDQARNVYRLPDELQADPEISTRDGWIWVGSPTKNAGPKYHLPIEVQPHFIEPTIG